MTTMPTKDAIPPRHVLPNDPEPVISVIVPVRNDPGHLRQCIKSLAKSAYRRFEVIVVDDSSTDDTASVAESLGVRVVRRPRQGGPANARNDGAHAARGEIVLFIDADVCVHGNTLCRIAETFERDASIDAVFGSYDKEPRAYNIISQYRNLLHHFVHQGGNREASTFWAGCGAVRRSVFLSMQGFDARYRRPCIEDIELGVRLRQAGHKIVLDRDILVTHLKRWTFWGMLRADVFDRALPWTELILQENAIPNDLNLKVSQRISALLALALLGCLAVKALYWQPIVILPLVVLGTIVLLDYWSLTLRVPTTIRVLGVLLTLAAAVFIVFYFWPWALFTILCFVGIVALNYEFYAFLAREKHPLFAAISIPLHVFFFVYSSLAFASVFARHQMRRIRRSFRHRQPETAGSDSDTQLEDAPPSDPDHPAESRKSTAGHGST